MKKLLRVLSVLVLSVVALYYVGVNALLASPWGELALNNSPQLVQIHYTRAWTLIPLQFEVRDFQLSMQDRTVQVMITADEVHGNLHPWTLLHQRFMATQVKASGVVMHIRPRMKKGDPLEAHLAELPPILGYETALLDQAENPNEVQAKEIQLLSLEFIDLEVSHLRELWIDRMRYTGDATVTGGMLYEPFRRLAIDDGHLVDAKSKLVAVEPNEVSIESLDLRVTLPEVNTSKLDFDSFRGLMADVKLSASAQPRFLNDYLTNVSGLSTVSVSGNPGQLEVDLQVVGGVVTDGAKLSYRSSRIAVKLPLVEVWGAAAVTGRTAKGRLALSVDISNAALKQRDGEQLVDADLFELDAVGPADLTRAIDIDAVIKLQGGHLKTLTSLNQFIPGGAGVHFGGGTGLVEATVKLDSAPARTSGELQLTASDVTVKNRSATITGKLLVHGKLHSLNANTGAMDLSGSTVSIEGATLVAQGRSWQNLWLRAVADPCLLSPNADILWSTKLAVGSSNLQPLLAIVSANAPLPGVLGMFTDSPNVKLEATMMVRADRIDLPKFSLTSQNVRVEGVLTLREASPTDPKLEPWGNVVAHAGALSAGVQLDGPKISVVLGDLQRWTAERKLVPTKTLAR
ncbi:MAG: hypothetical protein Q8K32_24740 [Archangium sp.]|nr:hypothetical protein [Archangium sp.]